MNEIKIVTRYVVEVKREGSSWGNHPYHWITNDLTLESAVEDLFNISSVDYEQGELAHHAAQLALEGRDFGEDSEAYDEAYNEAFNKASEKIEMDFARDLERDGEATFEVDVETYRVRAVKVVVETIFGSDYEIEHDTEDDFTAEPKFIAIIGTNEEVVLLKSVWGRVYLAVGKSGAQYLVYSTNAAWEVCACEDDVYRNWMLFQGAGLLAESPIDLICDETAGRIRDEIRDAMHEDDAEWFVAQYECALNFSRLVYVYFAYAMNEDSLDGLYVSSELGYKIKDDSVLFVDMAELSVKVEEYDGDYNDLIKADFVWEEIEDLAECCTPAGRLNAEHIG